MTQSQHIISLKNGKLRGSTKVDWKGRTYYSFQGIPYAKAPVGDLRFKAPQPAPPWTGIKDATKEGSECYSRNLFRKIVGSEDCLFLNVYTPEVPTNNSNLKPVMVWIHGGNFTSGSGNYDMYGPDFLIAEDVVVVTINYRLGILGFANFEDPLLGIPGNAGLKDQVLALKWVQENIDRFGGNPDNVTIFGESAGGAAVHHLVLSPMAKGLFHKAISQSGVATSIWAMGQRTAPLISKALGLSTTNEAEIVKILVNLPVKELLALQEKIPDPFAIHKRRPFAPVIETYSTEPMFLSKDIVEIMKSGSFNKVPFMIGYNSMEGMLLYPLFDSWKANFRLLVPYDLKLPEGSERSKIVANKIRQFYYGNETPSHDNILQYIIMQTDAVFFIPINKVVRYLTQSSNSPIYYYKMSADTRLNLVKNFTGMPHSGAAHGDELGYLFKTSLTPEFHSKSPEDIALQRIVKLWTTFAKFGNPNPVEKDPLISITWPHTENKKLYFLDIGENLTVGVNPGAERVELWDTIYELCRTTSKM